MKNNLPLEQTLLPALFECFGIMLFGYILGKFGILGQNEAKGISKFVQNLALPSLIFVQISTMAFKDVKWEFVASVFVTKACIFAGVMLLTIVLTHPPDLGKSGMYAIASTQSNDFALAYPLFISLYKNSHSKYPSYLYIVAPIQLIILNTVGFFIIETQKQNFNDKKTCHIWKIIKETLKNPVVFMTIIGMVWNITYGNEILPILGPLLKTLSKAFPATALLLVGHTMAMKGGKNGNNITITVALLIITKNLILPIILQKFSAFMLQGSSDDERQSFSSFGFLYGTVPTAPSAYVFAVQYDTCVDVVTKTIIGSTLLSAPLMFASASVISISQMGIENTSFYLSLTIRYLSFASLLCCSWLLFSFIIGKKFQNINFKVTLYIFSAQFLTSLGGILLFFSKPTNSVIFYVQYILSIGGIYAMWTCTLFLAILLLIIRWRSLCYILLRKKHINIISWLCLIVPFIIAGAASFLTKVKTDDPNCQLGYSQSVVTFTLTLICLIGTIICLISQHICFRNKSNEISIQSPYQSIGESEHIIAKAETSEKKRQSRNASEDEISVDVEDIGKCFESLLTETDSQFDNDILNDLCDSRHQCSIERRLQCVNSISIYRHNQEKSELYYDTEIFQHTTVLIALSVSMTLSISVCLWKIIMEKVDGIFIELEFLDIIFSYGLGILFFIIFGFNKGLLNLISSKWKMLCYSKNKNDTIITSADVCYEFMTKYEKKFKMDVHNLKSAHCDKFLNVFCSSDLTEWLIENEVAKNAEEANVYILSLEEGQIIQKVDDCRFFPESESIYKLTDRCDETGSMI